MALPSLGYWTVLTGNRHILQRNGNNICMPPHVVQKASDLAVWHNKLLSHDPPSSRNTIFALVRNKELERIKHARKSGVNGGGIGKLELGAEMHVLPRYAYCAFDRTTLPPDEYRSEAGRCMQKLDSIRSPLPAVPIAETIAKLGRTGYRLDMPAPGSTGTSTSRFKNPADARDLVGLTKDAFGCGMDMCLRYITAVLQNPEHHYVFAIRNSDGDVASYVVAQYLIAIPAGQERPLPVFLLSNATTSTRDRGRGLMTVLYHAAAEFLPKAVKGPVVLYAEAWANNDAILKAATRAGFRFGGCLPAFDKCGGEPVAVDLLYLPCAPG